MSEPKEVACVIMKDTGNKAWYRCEEMNDTLATVDAAIRRRVS